MKRQRKIWRLIISGVGMTILAFLAAAWFAASALIAPANRSIGPAPDQWPIEELEIPSASGSNLAAWYIPHQQPIATLVLLHPLRTNRRAMLGRAQLFHDAGYAILLVDLQAHGESPGENITAGHRERLDAAAAVDYVHTRSPHQPIGVVGWSLGGAAALLASPLPIDALVLESVYPTINEAVNNRIAIRMGLLSHLLTPALLVQLEPRLGVSPAELAPIEHLSKVDCPVLIVAGDLDEHTTLAETKRLYNRAKEPKQLLVFAEAGHEDLLKFDPEHYREVVSFLDAHLGRDDAAQLPGLE